MRLLSAVMSLLWVQTALAGAAAQTFTDPALFAEAVRFLPGPSYVEGFDSTPTGPLPAEAEIGRLTLRHDPADYTLVVGDRFPTTSSPRSLGSASEDEAFIGGDALGLRGDRPVQALAVTVIAEDEKLEAGYFGLETDGGVAVQSAAPVSDRDGTSIYFLGLIDPGGVEQARFNASGAGDNVFNLDDFVLAGGIGPDADGDGVDAPADNCPSWPNPDQADADRDREGDACECGDATGDGLLNSIDARIIQRCAIGIIPCPELCDVTGEGECNSIDARIVQRAAIGLVDPATLRCQQRGLAPPDPGS